MRPQTDPARCCLPVADWPDDDRTAWLAAVAANDPLSFECSTAASWKPATVHKNRRGYGRWLTFLQNSGADLAVAFADRVTQETVTAYLEELRHHGVAPYTVRNRIHELLAVMLALAPDRNWSWLKACAVHFDRRAEDTADHSLPPVLASDLLDRATKELRRRAQAPASCRDAIAYRDWLMLAVLTVMPLRLRNFAALSLTRHMERRDGLWWINIDGSETKTGRPHAASIPAEVDIPGPLPVARASAPGSGTRRGSPVARPIGLPPGRTHDLHHHHGTDAARLRDCPQSASLPAHLRDQRQHRGSGGNRRRPGGARSRHTTYDATSLQSRLRLHRCTEPRQHHRAASGEDRPRPK